MLSQLRERCPVLCPSVIPSGLADSEQNIGLLALCADTDEKRALATLLQSVRATKRACALTAREADEEGALRFVSQWELDADAGTYRLHRCDFVCAEAALLLDTAALLERFSRADADSRSSRDSRRHLAPSTRATASRRAARSTRSSGCRNASASRPPAR